MSIVSSIRDNVLVPIHPAGRPFIAIFAAIGVGLWLLWSPLWFLGVVLTLWCVYFFRNPVRTTPEREGLVVSPADGRVLSNGPVDPPAELGLPDGNWRRISIFMNVFDVHVNRAPMAGTIRSKFYFPGMFLDASLDKASEKNERLGLVMDTDCGRTVGFVQIAGLVARRILCDVDQGSRLQAGEHYGLIRFGSRVDVYVTDDAKIFALPGQKTIAGETILADFDDDAEPPRGGIAR